MQKLAELVGVPGGGVRRFAHIAGTNGKGSVTAMVEAMVRASGVETGSCFSPYVYTVRERAMAGGKMISEADFVRGTQEIRQVCAELEANYGQPTVFEIYTALGFWYWEQQKVETAVVEVGLGGVLDCTNIISADAGAIVSIGFDHMDVLGETLAEIALEKAGIAKPGMKLVVGEVPAEAADVIRDYANEAGAEVDEFGRDWRIRPIVDSASFGLVCRFGSFEFPRPRRLRGAIQIHNAAVAALTFLHLTYGRLDLSAQLDCVREGLERATMPGRFEVLRNGGRTWVFDGAHNEQAVGQLVRSLRQEYPGLRPTVILGMMNNHDASPVVDLLSQVSGDIRCVPINWHRTQDPAVLAAMSPVAQSFGSIQEAVTGLESDLVVVTGSFYLLKEMKEVLGIPLEQLLATEP